MSVYYYTLLANMSNDNTSTLKSVIDSATGAVQNAFGSVTGSTADQVCTSSVPVYILYYHIQFYVTNIILA